MVPDSESERDKAFEDIDIVSQQREILKKLRENSEALDRLIEKVDLLEGKAKGSKKG